MNPSLQKSINQTFLQLVEDLKSQNEIEVVFKDLLGEDEYNNLVKKLAVVYWLRKKRPLDVIQNNLVVNKKLISEVASKMDKDGIKLAIKYMEAEEFANTWLERIKKFKK